MPSFQPGLSADQVHRSLVSSLAELRRAQQCAVLWFSEVQRRKLYRELGYGSLQQYAQQALGFSQAKTYQFLRLADALTELPKLREATASGEVGWTKARAVASVATPRTEARWVREASSSSRRQLEQQVKQVRQHVRQRVRQHAVASNQQATLPMAPPEVPAAVDEVPVSLTLRMTSLQRARFEAMVEKARKQGQAGSREELLLAALEDMVAGPAEHSDCTRVHSGTPYQIVIHKCVECGKMTVPTTAGERPLSRGEAEAVSCDARVLESGQRNRATIAPAVRREVLARDGHRCQMPGCRHTRFLEVHHKVPRAAGGSNRPENLITMCSSCHSLVHEKKLDIAGWRSPLEQNA